MTTQQMITVQHDGLYMKTLFIVICTTDWGSDTCAAIEQTTPKVWSKVDIQKSVSAGSLYGLGGRGG